MIIYFFYFKRKDSVSETADEETIARLYKFQGYCLMA
jgi:hypothetical protein